MGTLERMALERLTYINKRALMVWSLVKKLRVVKIHNENLENQIETLELEIAVLKGKREASADKITGGKRLRDDFDLEDAMMGVSSTKKAKSNEIYPAGYNLRCACCQPSKRARCG